MASPSALKLSCARGGRPSSTSSPPPYVRLVWIVQLLLTLLLAAFSPLPAAAANAASGSIPIPAADNVGRIQSTGAGGHTLRATLIHRDKFLPESFVSSESGDPEGSSSHSSSPRLALGGEAHDGARRSLRRANALARQTQSLRERRLPASDEEGEEESASFRRSRLQSTEDPGATSPGPAAGPSGDWESPLSDASDAEYIMEITLGTPAQTYHAVADTGSDLTWIQCEPCDGSGCFQQADPLYDPSKSSTYQGVSCDSDACDFLSDNGNCVFDTTASPTVACEYFYAYGDNSSTSGTLAQDTISLDAYLSSSIQRFANYTFGCSNAANSSSSLFEVTDGLVGLGRGKISFPSQLGEYFGYKFSYCLVNKLSTTVQESTLVFGDGALSNGLSLQYTPLSGNPATGVTTFYYVEVENVTVNGAAVPILNDALDFSTDGSGGIFFDSGTTYTVLVEDAFDPLVTAVSSGVSGYRRFDTSDNVWELCYESTWNSWSDDYGTNVPKISFNFLNASSYDLGVQAAYVEIQTGIICLAFLRSQSSNIIGSYQQIDMFILYDLANDVIGFTPQRCESTDTAQRQPSSARRFTAPSGWTFTFLLPAILLLHASLVMIAKHA